MANVRGLLIKVGQLLRRVDVLPTEITSYPNCRTRCARKRGHSHAVEADLNGSPKHYSPIDERLPPHRSVKRIAQNSHPK
jgi:hypothetical protein